MKSAIFFAALVAGVSAQSFTVNTPTNAVVCEPLQISWSGGNGPFFLSILPGSNPSGTALINFGQQSSPFTWPAVNLTQSIGITVRDSTGATAQTAAFSPTGSDTSCLNGSGASSSGGSSTSGSTSGSSTTTSGTDTKSSSSSSKTSSSASSTSTTSSSSAAGPTLAAQYGAAGVLGAVVAAVLV